MTGVVIAVLFLPVLVANIRAVLFIAHVWNRAAYRSGNPRRQQWSLWGFARRGHEAVR